MSIPSSRGRPVRGRGLSNPRRPAAMGFVALSASGVICRALLIARASLGCAEDGEGMAFGITYLSTGRLAVDTSDASGCSAQRQESQVHAY